MKAIGIILAGGNNSRMRELSDKRAIAAMPVAGSYRSIDFALSNMANSHVQKVAVLTQYNARSLNEHLSSSKWWDFGRKQGGLFVFTPTITKDNSLWYQGTADAIYQNIDFLKKSHEPYVVIASGDCIYKMDYNKVLDFHISKRADITVVCTTCKDQSEVERFGVVRMNDECRIEEFEEKPIVSNYNTISTGIYVIRRRQLIELLELQKSLTYFITSLRSNEVVLEKLLKIDSIKKYPEDTDLLEDVITENKQAIEMANVYSGILNGTMDAFASIISNNMNIVMKVLAIITIVMSIPTIVFSAYGMNVAGSGMPLSRSPLGFLIIILISVAISVVAAIILSKKRFF